MTTVVGRGKEVSEKSLELNVCAEILQYVRSWPGCERALWLGLTQAQERRAGIDELLRNAGPSVALMFQFKAPWAKPQVDTLYQFSINEQQHESLEQLAGRYPDDVYYVFPLYRTWAKADRDAPDLVQDTWLTPVASMPLAMLRLQSTPTTGRHRVELRRVGSDITVIAHSPQVIGQAINAKDYLSQIDRGQSLVAGLAGVPAVQLREWAETVDNQRAPLRFRGLSALLIPLA